jgi:hypothetical protein
VLHVSAGIQRKRRNASPQTTEQPYSGKSHLNFKYTLRLHRKKQFNLGCGPEGGEDKWGKGGGGGNTEHVGLYLVLAT